MFYEEILEEVFDKDILEVLGDTRRFWRIFTFTNIGRNSFTCSPTSHKRPSKKEELVVPYKSRTAGGLSRREVWTHLIFRENVLHAIFR